MIDPNHKEQIEGAFAWGTSGGLVFGSLMADLSNILHVSGLAIGVAIGLLQLRKQWRNRNK